jgi:hypothetical protein
MLANIHILYCRQRFNKPPVERIRTQKEVMMTDIIAVLASLGIGGKGGRSRVETELALSIFAKMKNYVFLQKCSFT